MLWTVYRPVNNLSLIVQVDKVSIEIDTDKNIVENVVIEKIIEIKNKICIRAWLKKKNVFYG